MQTTSFQIPPVILDTLVSELFPNTASINPDHPFAIVLQSDGFDLKTITWQRFLSDARHVAYELARHIPARALGEAQHNIGLLARGGYSYAVHWLAIQLNHWTGVLISKKNSNEAIRHLLEVSNSTHLIVDEGSAVTGTQALEPASDIQIVKFVALPDIGYNSDPSTTTNFNLLSQEEKEKELNLPAFYLHTSGSTGHPRLIPWSHRMFSRTPIPALQEADSIKGQAYFYISPIYHAFGTIVFSLSPAVGITSFFSESNAPITGESVLKHLSMYRKHLSSDRMIYAGLVPSLLEEIAGNGPDAITQLARMTQVTYFGGATLSISAGEELLKGGVNVRSAYGMTELSLLSKFNFSEPRRQPGEWTYVEWYEGSNVLMLDTDEEDVKELIVLPGENTPAVLDWQNGTGFQTHDLWMEHPTRTGLWKHVGRKGGVTVLSNGEKTNNRQLEAILTKDSRIRNVLVFGAKRPQNGIVVSPSRNAIMSHESFLDEIWPAIEAMNKEVPAHSRVVRELVLLEDQVKKPFQRTDKGTVREKETLDMYMEDIDRAYDSLEEGKDAGDVDIGALEDGEKLGTFLSNTVKGLVEHELGTDDDFFENGFDSLAAARLHSIIAKLAASSPSKPNIRKNVVYHHPSIGALTRFLFPLLSPSSETAGQPKDLDDIAVRAQLLLDRWSANFKTHVSRPELVPQVEGLSIAVTGTTGSLGSFVVSQLLHLKNVRRVYLLNRRSGDVSTRQRQLKSFEDRGLDAKELEAALDKGRAKMFDVNLSKGELGLSEDDYEELRLNITHIIHSAWQLNFNLRMEAFESAHIGGVRHLIDLALSSPHQIPPRFIFLSTIGSVQRYRSGPTIPEEPFSDVSIAENGYGQSKFVSERMLDRAVKETDLRGTVVRIGQISGDCQVGSWATSEYMPILFRTSAALGSVPEDLPPVRWIPVDVAASVVIHQTLTDLNDTESLLYFHLENPSNTPWSDIAEALAEYKQLKRVSMSDWLNQVRRVGAEEPEKVPAIRLLEFFENIHASDVTPMDVRKTLGVAPELGYGAIGGKVLLKYFTFQGL